MVCEVLADGVERRESLTRKSSTDAVRRERARLLEAQAVKAERENWAAAGELVPIAEYKRRSAAMITQTRQRLLQLPGRLAPQLEDQSGSMIRTKLLTEVRRVLTSFSLTEAGD